MTVFDNPFHTLGASLQDDRRRLVALAEERSLLLDADTVAQARNILTNPQKRLAAEIRWFPGLGADVIAEILDACMAWRAQAQREAPDILCPSKLSELNVQVSMLPFRPMDDVEEATRRILQISRSFEALQVGALEEELNLYRSLAGFPPVVSASEIEEELRGHRGEIRNAISLRLKAFSQEQHTEICNALAQAQTKAEDGYYAILDDVLDDYGLAVALELEDQKKQILGQASAIDQAMQTPGFGNALGAVLTEMKRWAARARPLQLLARGRGQRHWDSEEIAYALREMAIKLHNGHRLTVEALEIVKALKASFSELPGFAEQMDESIQTLEQVLAEKEEEKKEEREARHRNRMNIRYSVTLHSAQVMIPSYCTCCMKSTKKTEKISASASAQSFGRTMKRTVSMDMPLCEQCAEHRKQAKRRTRLLILLAAAMALLSIPLFAVLPLDSPLAFWLLPHGVAAAAYVLFGLVLKLPALDDEHSTMQQSVWLGGIEMTGNLATFTFTNWAYAKRFMKANARQADGSSGAPVECAYRNRLKLRAQVCGIDRPIVACFQTLMVTAILMVFLGGALESVGRRMIYPLLAASARQSAHSAYTTARPTAAPTQQPTARLTARPTAKPTEKPTEKPPAADEQTRQQTFKTLKDDMDEDFAAIEEMKGALERLALSMDFYQRKYQETSGAWYRNQYNAYVDRYNTLWEQYNQAIQDYNAMVQKYNAMLD